MDFVSVKFFIKKTKGKNGVRIEENLDKIPENKRSLYQELNVKLRPLTWSLSNRLNKECLVKDKNTGFDEIDSFLYQEKKLKLALLEWNLMDDLGNPVIINDESIMNLNPLIAEAILAAYNRESYLSDRERKELITDVSVYIRSLYSDRGNYKVSPPPEIIEISLFDKFGWTPEEVDRIPLKRLQKMFLVMNEKDSSTEVAKEQALKKSREQQK